MDRHKLLLAAGTFAALTAIALAGPAGAADTKGTVAVVNGIPGKRVDVCLEGTEIKNHLAYGKAVLKNVVGTGAKRLKVYEADPRRCKGPLIAQSSFTLDPAEDVTIVVTKDEPRVVIFDNQLMGEILPTGADYPVSVMAWRDAAEMPVAIRSRVWAAGPEYPVSLAADPISTKGKQIVSSGTPGDFVRLRVTLPDDPETIAVKRVELGASRRYEWILVGSNAGNARFVLLDRVISQPSP